MLCSQFTGGNEHIYAYCNIKNHFIWKQRQLSILKRASWAFCFPEQVQLVLHDYVVHHINARISTRKLCRLIISKSVRRQAEARKANTPSPCAYWSSDTGQLLQNRSSWCNPEGWRGQNRRSPPCRYHIWCQQHFSANTAAIKET